MKLIFITLIFFQSISAMAQVKADSAMVFNHFYKSYISSDGLQLGCGLRYACCGDSIKTEYYIIEDQTDLIYCKEYLLSGTLFSAGYYKLRFNGESYCWTQDLSWLYFNSKGKLVTEKYYFKGYLINEIKHLDKAG